MGRSLLSEGFFFVFGEWCWEFEGLWVFFLWKGIGFSRILGWRWLHLQKILRVDRGVAVEIRSFLAEFDGRMLEFR